MDILALDLGQSKSVCCDYQRDGRRQEFVTIDTNPGALHDLIVARNPEVVVIEICTIAGWIRDLCEALGVKLLVANTSDEPWQWRKIKRKTDRDDALKLARLAAMEQIKPVHIPAPAMRQWRMLIHYRQKLVGLGTSTRNRIRAILQMVNVELPAGAKGFSPAVRALLTKAHGQVLGQCEDSELWRGIIRMELDRLKVLEHQIDKVEKRLDALAAKDERVARLQEAPAVGPRTAELVVALMDDPKRFSRGKQVAAYAGLTPRKYQSGQRDRDGSISRAGNGYLRMLLVQASWVGIHRHGWMRTVYERVRRGSEKRKKKAIIAVSRHLLIRLWAMLRDGTHWRDEPLASVE
jgi:transposase